MGSASRSATSSPAVSYCTRRSRITSLRSAIGSGSGADAGDPAHVRVEHLWNPDRSVRLAMIFDDRRPHSRHGQGRPVEGVHEAGALLRLAVVTHGAVADVGAPSLVVAEPAHRRDLEPFPGP